MERMVRNREMVLVSYSNEGPVTDDHLKIRESQLNLNACKEGELIVKNMWASVDPFLRWLMKEEINTAVYMESFKLNQAIVAFMVGKVVVSANPEFEVGDLVTGLYQLSDYSIVEGSKLRKIDTNLAKPSDYLGTLGIHLLFR